MSKRIAKQVLLVFLVMSMLIAPLHVLAADENVNLTGMPIVNEPITMTMMLPIDVARGIDPESNTVWQYLEELTGIHWEYIVVDKSSWSERLNLTWASNDLPDLIYAGVNMADLRAYTGRQIMDIAPYLDEYAPNVMALMEESNAAKLAMIMPDGKVGSFIWTNMDVSIGSGQCPPDMLLINQEWLDALGLEMPQTVDEYIETLKAFRDGDPNGNGLADEIALSPRFAWKDLCKLQPLSGFMSSTNYSVFLDGDTVKFTPFMDEYKEYMELLVTLYSEKLIDPDIFVINNSQVTAKGSTETQIYGSIISAAAFTNVGQINATAFVPTPVYTAANGKQMWYTRVFATPGVGVITTACDYPQAAVRWCDLFYSDEYQKLVWMGIEGDAYQFTDETRTTWEWVFSDDMTTTNEVRAKKTIQAGGQGPSICPEDWFNLNDATEAPVNAQRKQIGSDYFGKLRVAMPDLYYSSSDQKELTAIWNDLKTYIEQQTALFATGELDIEENWDDFIQMLKNMGAETMVDIIQATYDSYGNE